MIDYRVLIGETQSEGFDIHFYAMPEYDSPDDHFDDKGETAEAIREGRFDWFAACVTASKNGIELGADYLGGCCYESPQAFMDEPDGYFADMVSIAIANARDVIAKLAA